MATIVLSAAGMVLGGSVGGSILGLSMATIGRAAGAALGRRIDQQLLGGGSEAVETGRIDRIRLTGASEGADLQQIYGRMRVPGQVIWATNFKETSNTTGGGKGTSSTPETTTFAYSVSLAVGLCEGEIGRVGRIWADGVEVSADDLNMRLYRGTADQLPDPKITAVEGAGNAPGYRGTAYVVFEDLPLGQFGNRVPQFTFEVMRSRSGGESDNYSSLSDLVSGVALIPGTGEYSLATTPVYLSPSYGEQIGINLNSPIGGTDFSVSMDALEGELPKCGSTVLVVSWFGDDLRCGNCSIEPKIEQRQADGAAMPWRVSGRTRDTAPLVAYRDDEPVYGGTPTDAAVIEAIRDLATRGLDAVFYPFILMEQLSNNTLPNPWTALPGQPALPWRGRITTSLAPTMSGTPDRTAAATAEVDAFMGDADPSDFSVDGTQVNYSGPNQWGYRRFILHYAHLCAAAGGVTAFCIGSEMRALTQIRGENDSFPAVQALRDLAADVRSILGSDCKISYAADWSEYHGYQPVGTADKYFHLDPLWSDPNVDFIGVDNYMPLSDWRDGEGHADADWGSIYNPDYLKSNVAGGEGFDWFYTTPEARDAQRRTPITDGEGEPWVWRVKDFKGWWRNQHFDRIDGVRQTTPTSWLPESKPIWFTELGCAAIEKGANQPNKFLDPKSSESRLPYYSNGNRDDFMQMQYLRAVIGHFSDPANNPISVEYDDHMIATDRMHVWAWDARPYPFFPGNRTLWSDGDNYARGHWLNGRATNRTLASVVAEICDRSGVTRYDVSELYGVVRGYAVGDIGSARAALQPLMTTYGFEAMEREGVLVFHNRNGRGAVVIDHDELAIDPEKDQAMSLTRSPAAEIAGRVQLGHIDADADYETVAAEAILSDEVSFGVSRSEVPIALTRNEGRNAVTRWIHEARVGRDTASFALPPSLADLGAGDVIALNAADHSGVYRIDRVDESGVRLIEATRIDPEVYRGQTTLDDDAVLKPFVGPIPVEMLFLDLPLLTGDEVPHAPHVAAAGRPWPGSVALYASSQDSGYVLQEILREASVIGLTQTDLFAGPTGIWDRQDGLELQLVSGALSSVTVDALLSGQNTIAIGDGSADLWEIIQFRDAVPLGDRRYGLCGLLRGQLGSRGLMPPVWPAGSTVVILDGRPQQITIPTSARGNDRYFRYGPAKRPITDPSFRYARFAFRGNGLRPYPVAHLRAAQAGSDVALQWIRCSRIDGDIWSETEIPLGEETESYRLRIIQNGTILREVVVDAANWNYDGADVDPGPYRVEVAQLSRRYGAGPFVGITIAA